VLVSDFNYFLPPELIANQPLLDRAGSRLLHLRRDAGTFRDRQFQDFPDLLRQDDLVVFNNTRVFPARLLGRRSGAKTQPVSRRNPASRGFLKGKVELLLTRQISSDPNEWECLVRPGRKIGVGECLFFGNENELQAEVLGRGSFGERTIRFAPVTDFFGVLDRLGHVPLPPYIKRSDRAEDRERYQTIYARERGSVAAPTAGLHFSSEILARMRKRGLEMVDITLHVGLGTFQPVRVKNVEEHRLHGESYFISEEAATRIHCALDRGRRIVAIGTTTVRTVEDSARSSRTNRVRAGMGEAKIFIYPGHEFRIVGALLTNFHLPQSTLLMLVSAFAGKDTLFQAYQHALKEKYRFYSYGDCMFIE
jgi:S-adenosylmethionine:tRNA ribosyltransferase-isomerase